MSPEKSAFEHLSNIYNRTIDEYVRAMKEVSRKNRVRYSTSEGLIRYALRRQFYGEMCLAPYFWSGRDISNALLKLRITDEKRWWSGSDEDREDSFLCDEHIQAYKRKLRREARKKSKPTKER